MVHLFVLLQPLGEDPRRLALTADANLERLQPAHQEPRGVGRCDDPGARPELEQAGGMLRALADDGAEEHVVMAREVLGRRVEHEVAAELERP